MKLKDKTILVTGGAGIIGLELIKRLAKIGVKIFCIDRAEKPMKSFNVKRYINKDLNDLDMEEIIEIDPEIIFHLAATFERTEETPGFWGKNYENNIKASHFILDIARNCKSLVKFIFASSYLVYDQQQYLFNKPQKKPVKLRESARVDVRNICGASKYYIEKELDFLRKSGIVNFDPVSVRIFRVYGINSRDFISRCIRAGLRGEKIELYRKEGLFDYIYSEDVAEGLIRLAKFDATGIVNLGSGKANSVETALNCIKNEINDLIIEEKEKNNILYEASCADISRLENLTNWKPEISLAIGVKKIIDNERKKHMM